MDFIGFDLGKVSSQVCILTGGGELIERRIRTDRDHFDELLGSRSTGRSGRGPTWGWCLRSAARASGSSAGTSRRRARVGRGTCWSRRRGRS
jgi:hypothetical protein